MSSELDSRIADNLNVLVLQRPDDVLMAIAGSLHVNRVNAIGNHELELS